MKINNIYESFGIEFPGSISLVISVSGCEGSCVGCHSKKLKNYNIGTEFSELKGHLKFLLHRDQFFKSIVVVGGDLVDAYNHDQSGAQDFVEFLQAQDKELVLYTHYELNNIPEFLKDNFDYVKTGTYDQNIPPIEGSILASGNQKMYEKDLDGTFTEIFI